MLRISLNTYTYFARELRLSLNTIRNVWRRYCYEYESTALPSGGFRIESSKLDPDDLEFIEVLKTKTASISLAEIIDTISDVGRLNGKDICISTVSRALESGCFHTIDQGL